MALKNKSDLRKKSDLLADILLDDNESDTVKALADMRWMSNFMGIVYEEQANQLKKLANLTFSPDVAVISISQPTRAVKVESSGQCTEKTKVFPEMVQFLLGKDWTVEMQYNVSGIAPSRKTSRAKSKRKKRS